jgi:hypothetical protein
MCTGNYGGILARRCRRKKMIGQKMVTTGESRVKMCGSWNSY